MTHIAAELRANRKLPYTDCFAAALAAHRKGSLATSDPDFAAVEKKIDILWTIGLCGRGDP
ncbi:MAG: PIN domain-containing protein [Candidatus Acidiferrales bacterium]